MATSVSRQAVRAALRTSRRAVIVPAAARQGYRAQGRRFVSNQTAATQQPGMHQQPGPQPEQSGGSPMLWLSLLAAAGLGGYYYYSTQGGGPSALASKVFSPTKEDYQKVYDAVAQRLEEKDDYDDGSYGPVVLRLAWHCSGTWDNETKTGGSNGATMRFDPESSHAANSGLKAAREFLEPIHQQFPWISYSDLWIIAGICAVQEMQGPIVPFRPGRTDGDIHRCSPDGRLPDASKDQKHIRQVFNRMGFNDQEMVCLIGAHALGRCHADRSGYDGPWSFSPTVMSNDYFRLLLDEKWQWKKWNGPAQFEDKKTKSLMMLPTDMALVQDKGFRKYVEMYAKDNDLFFRDFSKALAKLFELGVPYKEGAETMTFKPMNA